MYGFVSCVQFIVMTGSLHWKNGFISLYIRYIKTGISQWLHLIRHVLDCLDHIVPFGCGQVLSNDHGLYKCTSGQVTTSKKSNMAAPVAWGFLNTMSFSVCLQCTVYVNNAACQFPFFYFLPCKYIVISSFVFLLSLFKHYIWDFHKLHS